jgi:glycosyltransferase involved in cell wall biosynthesis
MVSLVVPVRNEESHIAACLRGILAQTYPRELLEIIVVDGESEDGTLPIARELAENDPRIRIATNPGRSMPSGLNVGIAEASGQFVGVVSGHSVLPSDYVEAAVEAILRTGAWSVGGQIVRHADTPLQRAIGRATSSPVGVGDASHNYATTAGWVDAVFPGFWRRDMFDRIGPFDPAMVANEDNELSLRIRNSGGRIWFDPAIRVEYVPRSTLSGLFRQYRMYGLGKMRLLRKHGGGLRWRHFVPAAWVAFLVGGGVMSVVASEARLPWLIGAGAYVAVIAVASFRLATRDAPWWLIALAFLTIHHAYGIGTWQGLATWSSTAPRPRA